MGEKWYCIVLECPCFSKFVRRLTVNLLVVRVDIKIKFQSPKFWFFSVHVCISYICDQLVWRWTNHKIQFVYEHAIFNNKTSWCEFRTVNNMWATIKFVRLLCWMSNMREKRLNDYQICGLLPTNSKNMDTLMHEFSQRVTSTMWRLHDVYMLLLQ